MLQILMEAYIPQNIPLSWLIRVRIMTTFFFCTDTVAILINWQGRASINHCICCVIEVRLR